ncbi:unnamed protein product [Vitrella brassicaformis CCMP3155]|uniref:Dynein heavy chain linker domain-containing protein n=1 Tax=Vitrella brassicaformis (strain CCMP3155) TaxID=1169540 RepID=A0A0G4FPW8_VITBC|nr:unnamed protein product [Vitrella brassicaformis CCMP3155]|eukprot:CEM16135.1 unnamed protein product [Vitrella brassicaformis CCMP3155]
MYTHETVFSDYFTSSVVCNFASSVVCSCRLSTMMKEPDCEDWSIQRTYSNGEQQVFQEVVRGAWRQRSEAVRDSVKGSLHGGGGLHGRACLWAPERHLGVAARQSGGLPRTARAMLLGLRNHSDALTNAMLEFYRASRKRFTVDILTDEIKRLCRLRHLQCTDKFLEKVLQSRDFEQIVTDEAALMEREIPGNVRPKQAMVQQSLPADVSEEGGEDHPSKAHPLPPPPPPAGEDISAYISYQRRCSRRPSEQIVGRKAALMGRKTPNLKTQISQKDRSVSTFYIRSTHDVPSTAPPFHSNDLQRAYLSPFACRPPADTRPTTLPRGDVVPPEEKERIMKLVQDISKKLKELLPPTTAETQQLTPQYLYKEIRVADNPDVAAEVPQVMRQIIVRHNLLAQRLGQPLIEGYEGLLSELEAQTDGSSRPPKHHHQHQQQGTSVHDRLLGPRAAQQRSGGWWLAVDAAVRLKADNEPSQLKGSRRRFTYMQPREHLDNYLDDKQRKVDDREPDLVVLVMLPPVMQPEPFTNVYADIFGDVDEKPNEEDAPADAADQQPGQDQEDQDEMPGMEEEEGDERDDSTAVPEAADASSDEAGGAIDTPHSNHHHHHHQPTGSTAPPKSRDQRRKERRERRRAEEERLGSEKRTAKNAARRERRRKAARHPSPPARALRSCMRQGPTGRKTVGFRPLLEWTKYFAREEPPTAIKDLQVEVTGPSPPPAAAAKLPHEGFDPPSTPTRAHSPTLCQEEAPALPAKRIESYLCLHFILVCLCRPSTSLQQLAVFIDKQRQGGIQKSLDRLSDLLSKNLSDLLSKIQKALGDYLEKQRSNFARFYFVGDADLVEMIFNSRDVKMVQRHLNKMFAGITALEVDTEDPDQIVGMSCREDEVVHFKSAVKISDDPELSAWLSRVEQAMQNTLAALLEEVDTGDAEKTSPAGRKSIDKKTPSASTGLMGGLLFGKRKHASQEDAKAPGATMQEEDHGNRHYGLHDHIHMSEAGRMSIQQHGEQQHQVEQQRTTSRRSRPPRYSSRAAHTGVRGAQWMQQHLQQG